MFGKCFSNELPYLCRTIMTSRTMKTLRFVFILICLSAAVPAVRAAEAPSPAVNDTLLNSALDSVRAAGRRPRIGLTFAGGGAKGAAHIGVLKVLEEVGIPIDYVTGTSMGSIIGALYSLGYNAEQMDSIISGMDWSVFMSDKMQRRGMSSREKLDDGRYSLTIPFNTGKLAKTVSNLAVENKQHRNTVNGEKNEGDSSSGVFMSSLPGGFIEGSNLLNLFNCLSVGYQDPMSFDDLPIPFACVVTDVLTGQEVVLREGRLPDAIRGSMAIPGVFSPVPYEDMLLVDGGMFNNFPVMVCQDMGADIVIGVEVAKEKAPDKSEIKSLPELLGRLFEMITRGSIQENRDKCTIHINPDITGYGTLSFDKASIRELITRGYKAADSQREVLVALKKELDKSGSPEKTVYHAPASRNLSPYSPTEVAISDVEINGVSEKDELWLKKKARLNDVSVINGTMMDKAVSICYGTGAFKSIRYYLTPGEDGRYKLSLNTVPAEPHVFSSGVRFDTEDAASVILRFGLNKNKLNGFKFDLSTRLSMKPWVKAIVSYSPRIFPTISLEANLRWLELPLGVYNANEYTVDFMHSDLMLYLSQYHSRNWNVAGGLKLDHIRFYEFMVNAENYIGVPQPYLDRMKTFTPFGIFVDATFDNLDNVYFATRGLKFMAQGDWRFALLNLRAPDDQLPGYYDDFNKNILSIRLDFESYIPLGSDVSLIPQFYGRYLNSDDDLYWERYSLSNFIGGTYTGRYLVQQQPFIGLNEGVVMNDLTVIARCDLRWNIYGKHYIYGMFNWGREAKDFSSLFGTYNYVPTEFSVPQESCSFCGAGIRYSYDTFMGPFCFQIHWSDFFYGKSFWKQLGIYLQWGYEF